MPKYTERIIVNRNGVLKTRYKYENPDGSPRYNYRAYTGDATVSGYALEVVHMTPLVIEQTRDFNEQELTLHNFLHQGHKDEGHKLRLEMVTAYYSHMIVPSPPDTEEEIIKAKKLLGMATPSGTLDDDELDEERLERCMVLRDKEMEVKPSRSSPKTIEGELSKTEIRPYRSGKPKYLALERDIEMQRMREDFDDDAWGAGTICHDF